MSRQAALWSRRSFVAAVLLAQSAQAQERSVAAVIKPGVNYTEEEREEIRELQKVFDQFEAASKEYRTAVAAVVKAAYEEERGKVRDRYDSVIKAEEKDERSRRLAAITLYEDFLRRHPSDPKWTPDVVYRLAELYFEKANDEYLQAMEKYEQELRAYESKTAAQPPVQPQQDYSASIQLYLRLSREFPDYRFLDGALYLMGYCLSEQNQDAEAHRAYLAVVCSNKHTPPTELAASVAAEEPEMSPARKRPAEPFVDPYADCTPLNKDGKFNAETWTRVGEYHFDFNELELAIAAYQKVLPHKDSPYYDKALYKLAWAYYRADRFTEAIREFDSLIKYADEQKEKTGKFGSDLRTESIQYLGICFAEEDWDGDTMPDVDTGIARIEKFYAGRQNEPHVAEVYQRLGDIYFDINKNPESIEVYKLALQRWPHRAENPVVQERVIMALERDRRFEDAIRERDTYAKTFGAGSDWERKNRGDIEALQKVRSFQENSLIQAAVFHHKAAQEFRKQCVAGDAAKCQQASVEYGLAGTAYQHYLEAFPNTKNSYEIGFYLAEAYFFSQQFLAAASAYETVRDSNLDNRYQQEAAFNAAKAYEEQIKLEIQAGRLPNPDMPKNETVQKPLAAQTVPALWQKQQDAYDAYARVLPDDPKAAALAFKAAEISYRFLRMEDARPRMVAVYEKYCKDDVALEALRAVIESYRMQDQERQAEPWVEKQASTACGSEEKRKGVTEEGKALQVNIAFRSAQELFDKKEYEEAAVKYEELIQKYPDNPDTPKAINNAAVAYENVQRYESATRLYEKLWRDHPNSEFADDALFRSAFNYQRFFEFDQAVSSYLVLAENKKYAESEHRPNAIFNAAVILEGDQKYPRAAQFFKKHADLAAKPDEAAESYFRAVKNYQKAKDLDSMVSAAREFQKRYGTLPNQAGRIVEATYMMAAAYDDRGDKKSADKLMRQTVSDFYARKLAPASEPAEWAARAAFWLAEKQFEAYQKLTISGQIEELPKQRDKVAGQARQLQDLYKSVESYKRVTWTLAAMTREGQLYEHFARIYADGFRKAPLSGEIKKTIAKFKKLGASEDDIQQVLDGYQVQVDEALAKEVEPLEQNSLGLYKIALEAAAKFGVSNEWTRLARERLNAYKPDEYPLTKEEKIEYQLD